MLCTVCAAVPDYNKILCRIERGNVLGTAIYGHVVGVRVGSAAVWPNFVCQKCHCLCLVLLNELMYKQDPGTVCYHSLEVQSDLFKYTLTFHVFVRREKRRHEAKCLTNGKRWARNRCALAENFPHSLLKLQYSSIKSCHYPVLIIDHKAPYRVLPHSTGF